MVPQASFSHNPKMVATDLVFIADMTISSKNINQTGNCALRCISPSRKTWKPSRLFTSDWPELSHVCISKSVTGKGMGLSPLACAGIGLISHKGRWTPKLNWGSIREEEGGEACWGLGTILLC